MPRFVVLKHQKSPTDLHYDLMFERVEEEVLWTWALQAPPPQEKGVEVEGERIGDHRVKYLAFEGEIGRGLGRVDRWEAGKYQTVKLSWSSGEISWWEVHLESDKLGGHYLLLGKEKNRYRLCKIL